MKKYTFVIGRLVFVTALLGGMSGCALMNDDAVFQVSTLKDFEDRSFDGKVTFSELSERGDFGVGVVDQLDGEMIAFEGNFFRMGSDSRIVPLEASAKTPFATVKKFKPDLEIPVDQPFDYAGLCGLLDWRVNKLDRIYAAEIVGRFAAVKVRSPHKQTKPYPSLDDVTKNQQVFETKNVRGKMIGFRFPGSMSGTNFTGWHFHFISDNRTFGGHVLDCRILEGTARVDEAKGLSVKRVPRS